MKRGTDMEELKKLVIDWIEQHEKDLDFWIKREKGEIVSIDISRNNIPCSHENTCEIAGTVLCEDCGERIAKKPAEDPAPLKVPFFAQNVGPCPHKRTTTIKSSSGGPDMVYCTDCEKEVENNEQGS